MVLYLHSRKHRDNELFQNADFAGHSETSGNCFFFPIERFEGRDYSYAGCTYGTSIIGVSIDSANYLDSEWTNEIIFTIYSAISLGLIKVSKF